MGSTSSVSSESSKSESSKSVSSIATLIRVKVECRKERLIVCILLALIIVNSFLFGWIFEFHKTCKKFAVLLAEY